MQACGWPVMGGQHLSTAVASCMHPTHAESSLCAKKATWVSTIYLVQCPGDVAAAVRLYLEKLDAPGRAAALVRKAGAAPEAAGAVARHCLAAGDHRSAVEFLLLAGQMDQVRVVGVGGGRVEGRQRCGRQGGGR